MPNAELIAECYIGFAKLLNEEMRAFDLKDNALFDTMKVASLNKSGNYNGNSSINGKASGQSIEKDNNGIKNDNVIKNTFAISKKK